MQHPEDDRTELFRRASRGIRLRLQEDDWHVIQQRLAPNDRGLAAVENTTTDRNKYKLLVTALLVYLISGTTLYTLWNVQNRPRDSRRENHPIINNGATTPEKEVSHSGQDRSRSQSRINYKVSHSANLDGVPTIIEEKRGLAYSEIKNDKMSSNLPGADGAGVHNPDRVYAAPVRTIISNLPGRTNKKDRRMDDPSGFYMGIVAGPQFNDTKEQEFSKPGMSAGLLAGVQLSRKLAIETGLVISDKRYHSAGEYFNMSKISATMPAGMKVLSLESKSTVWEIPLRIKYNWLRTNRGNLFGTAGLSSYILTKESNRYLASLNGSQEQLTGSYPQRQGYFAAAANLSAGYQYGTRKGMTFRIEPYVQIPLKKIGVGSLPILSTGISLGITIPLTR